MNIAWISPDYFSKLLKKLSRDKPDEFCLPIVCFRSCFLYYSNLFGTMGWFKMFSKSHVFIFSNSYIL